MHDPSVATEVAAARSLGGSRRRREVTLTDAFLLGDLGTVDGIRRLLDVAVLDALALDHGKDRIRLLMIAIARATQLLGVDNDARFRAIEAALGLQRPDEPESQPDDDLASAIP